MRFSTKRGQTGGTCQYAELKPDVPDLFFSADILDMNKTFLMNTSRRRNGDGPKQKAVIQNDIFEDDDIPDDAFLEAGRCVTVCRLISTNYTLSSWFRWPSATGARLNRQSFEQESQERTTYERTSRRSRRRPAGHAREWEIQLQPQVQG